MTKLTKEEVEKYDPNVTYQWVAFNGKEVFMEQALKETALSLYSELEKAETELAELRERVEWYFECREFKEYVQCWCMSSNPILKNKGWVPILKILSMAEQSLREGGNDA